MSDEEKKSQAESVTQGKKEPGASVWSGDDTQQPGDDSTKTVYSGGYGIYGGGGYGGKSPADAQRTAQQQITNTQGNYARRKKDMDKMAGEQLDNLGKQFEANDDALRQQNRLAQKGVQWQPNQQREQSTLMALRNRMGNSAYGSSTADLREGMGRIDDMNDVSLINAWKQNVDNAYSNWFQANTSLVSDWNDQVVSLEDEYSKLFSQYWSTLSNIDPFLAAEDRLKKAQGYYDKGKDTRVYNGESGTDKYYMKPLSLEPDAALLARMVQKDQASAINPLTRSYVRPDAGQTRHGRTNGTYSGGRIANPRSSQGTAANPAYYDEIMAYSKPRPESAYRTSPAYSKPATQTTSPLGYNSMGAYSRQNFIQA